MFFTKLAERTGLLDFIAPQPRNDLSDNDWDTSGHSSHGAGCEMENDCQKTAAQSQKDSRYRRLRAQYKAEQDAEERGVFAKKQRVLYHHRAADTYHEAVIVGVHFDDGPDEPYYTVKYERSERVVANDGTEKETLVKVEKQTNPERLTRVPWDDAASWDILR